MATANKPSQDVPKRATIDFGGIAPERKSKKPAIDKGTLDKVSEESGFPTVTTIRSKSEEQPAKVNEPRNAAPKPSEISETIDRPARRPGRPRSRIARTEQISPRLQVSTYAAFNWFYDVEGWSQAEVIEAALDALCRERKEQGIDIPPGVVGE